MSRVAITGANGFMGKYLIEMLLAKGYEVVAIGRSESGLADLPAKVKRHVSSYSIEDLSTALQGCQSLIHLAGRRSVRGEDMELVAAFAETGLSMLDALLRACLTCGVETVVQASSIAVYSLQNDRPYREDQRPVPASNYGLAKLFCEDYAGWWSKRHGVPVAHLRIAACYGAGEKLTPALMKMSMQAFRGEQLSISNGGHHAIDECYVKDVAGAFITAMEAKAEGPFNIGAGRAVTLLEIAQTANQVYGNEGNLVIEPANPDSSPNIHNHMIIDRAAKQLGWSPTYSLKDGLAEMRSIWTAEKIEEN